MQVDKLIFPVDFVVLEMETNHSRDMEPTILLVRPFMATTKTIIDVHEGKLTLTVLGETVTFKVFDYLSMPSIATIYECSYLSSIDSCVEEMCLEHAGDDKLELALIIDEIDNALDDETREYGVLLDNALHDTSLDSSTYLVLNVDDKTEKDNDPPILELK